MKIKARTLPLLDILSFILSDLFFIFLLSLFSTAQNSALSAENQKVEFLTYKSPSMSISGHILLLAEDLIKSKWQGIEFLGMEQGIAYSSGGKYLLTKKKIDLDQLNNNELVTTDQTELQYFETNKSFMIVSKEAPTAFVDQIKRYKNKSMSFQDQAFYWNDLNWGQVESRFTLKDNYPIYNFNKMNWKTSKLWDFSIYFNYKLKLNNQIFDILILPKQYGGMNRILSSLKKHETSHSITIGLGDITPPVDGADQGDLEVFELLEKTSGNPHYILASNDEIVGFQKYKEYYNFQNKKSKIHLISSNVYVTNEGNKKLAFEAYRIINFHGKKIALVGITAPRINNYIEKNSVRYPWLKTMLIEEPKELLQNEILPKVRQESDFIVIVTNMNSEERAKYLEEVEGVDLLIHGADRNYGSEKELSIDFKNFTQRTPLLPIYEISSSDMNLNITTINFNENNLYLKSQIDYLDQKYDLKNHTSVFSENFSSMIEANEIALPDHRSVYSDKIVVSKEEFANMAAEILRKKLNSEVGIFNVQTQKSSLLGSVDASVVKTWVRANEQLVCGYLKGSDLILLMDQNLTSDKNFKLSFAGIDKNKMIFGSAINSNEYYRISTSTAVSENLTKYPSFKNFSNKSLNFVNLNDTYEENPFGEQIFLNEMLSKSLVESWKQKKPLPETERKQFYRNLYEGVFVESENTGYWAHDFRNLRLEYSQLKTTDTVNFSEVRDSRLNTANQQIFSGRFDYSAYYRKNPVVSELGIKAQYSKLELISTNNEKNIYTLNDDLVLFANLGLPIFEVYDTPWFATNSGPIAELAYDTEFVSDEGQPYQKNIQSFLGWKFYNGSLLRSSLISLFNENRLSDSIKKNQWGATIRFEVDKSILEDTSSFKSQLDYKYYFSSGDDTSEDLRSRLLWDNYLDLKLTKNFSFGPFFKYATFTGKTFNNTALQTTIGFNLNFSSFWKPKFQKVPF